MRVKLFGNGKPQPRKCPSCKGRLPDAKWFEHVNYTKYLEDKPGYTQQWSDNEWAIECTCGAVLRWSYPGQWNTLELEKGKYERKVWNYQEFISKRRKFEKGLK